MKKKLLLILTVFVLGIQFSGWSQCAPDVTKPIFTFCPGNQSVGTNSACTYVHPSTSWDPIATDNCGGPVTYSYLISDPGLLPPYQSVSTLNGFTFPKGSKWVTVTATDAAGNNSDPCFFVVTVSDDDAPAITCPSDINILNSDAGVCGAAVSFVAPVGTDNCPSPSTSLIAGFASGSVFPVGTTTNTFRVTDGAGLTAQCSFNISVIDSEDPIISCPSNQTFNNTPSLCTYTNSGLTLNATATDNCNTLTYSYILSGVTTGSGSTLNGKTFNKGLTNVQWTVVDGSGVTNPSVCNFTITVVDNEPPIISCVANQSVFTDAGVCSYTKSGTSWNATGSDNCTTVNFTYALTGVTSGSGSSLNGISFNKGVTTVTWTATDSKGLTSTCSYTVTVVDNEAPIFVACGPSKSVNTDAGVCTYTKANNSWDPSASDNCSTSISYVLSGATSGSGTTTSGLLFNKGVNTLTWTVNDGSGNTATCNFNVTVTDNQDPTISCVANQSVNTDLGVCTYTKSGTSWNPTAADNCTYTLTYVLTGATSGSGSNTLNGVLFNKGVTTVTWTINDGTRPIKTCSNTITVVDNQNPTISCTTNKTVPADLGTCTYTNGGTSWDATASDNCTTTLTYTLTGVTTGTGSSLNGVVFNKGVTTVTWSVTDGVNPAQTCSYTVTVTDTQNPTVSAAVPSVSTNTDLNVCNALVAITNATFNDNCSGSTIAYTFSGATIQGLTSGQVGTSTFNKGTTTITYTVTDASGNTATTTMTVIVADAQNPTVSAAVPSVTVNAGAGVCNASVVIANATFNDNCTGSTLAYAFTGATIQGSTAGQVGTKTFGLGTTTITYTVTDASGNTNTATMTVIVNDTQNPTITCPSNITQVAGAGVCTSAVTISVPATADNCSVASVVNDFTGTSNASGTYPLGLTTVNYVVTDGSLNTANCSFTVTINDAQNPTITCPANKIQVADAGLCTCYCK